MNTCVELFAGCGGMTLGLQQAGFEHLLLIESDARCVETLKRNGFGNVVHDRVENVEYGKLRGKVGLVAGGVPCQAFSVGGLNKGRDDSRNLWGEAVRAVKEMRPKAFFFENSSAMTSPKHAPYLKELISKFESMGFTVHKCIVNAAHYGIPQNRKRLLLIGVRKGQSYTPPAPTTQTNPVTVRDVFSSLGPPSGINSHISRPTIVRTYRGHTGSVLDRPSKTVVSGCHGCPSGTNCITLDDGSKRHYTPREMARIQSFPDSFQLHPVWSTVVRQLGNACPPVLACTFSKPLLVCRTFT